MIEPEELASAPDYRWRRLWNQFWIHASVTVFLITAIASGDYFFIPALVTAAFYYLVSRKVVELDAAERGHRPGLSDAVTASLEKERTVRKDHMPSHPNQQLPSGLPVTSAPEPPAQEPRQPSTKFGHGKPPAKKPVDLPRHRP